MLQTEPAFKKTARGLIDHLLTATLTAIPGAGHVDLYVIDRHSGCGGARYSQTNSVATGKRAKAPTLQCQPLTDWAEFSLSLRAGRSRVLGLQDFRASAMLDRLRALEVSRLLACPVMASQSDMVGTVFVMWNGRSTPPSRMVSADPSPILTRTVGQVARILELCQIASRQSVTRSLAMA